MDREQARTYAKSCLESYLEQRGIPTRKPFRCLDPNHQDNNPSMSFDRANNRVVCFACGVKYDIFDLVALEYNLSDKKEIFERTYQILNISIDKPTHSGRAFDWNDTIGGNGSQKPEQPQAIISANPAPTPAPKEPEKPKEYPIITDYIQTCAARAGETDYFSRRGIPADIVQRFGLGYDPSFDPSFGKASTVTLWKAVTIPNGDRFCIIRNTNGAAIGADRYRKIGNNRIWNTEALYSDSLKPVFVTEGEFDALSIIAAGGEAVALGTATNYTQLLTIIDGRKAPFSMPLVLALDNDEAGQKAADKFAEELTKRKVPFYRENIYGEHKDANEALLYDKEAFSAAIAGVNDREQQEYRKNSVAGHLQEFVDGISDTANTPKIPTGFPALDGVLDGGFYEGFYVIGAISSLGKTTFMLQIIDQIAASGTDCLIFSLEMARSELMSKSISRLTLLETIKNGGDMRNVKTSRGITAGERYQHYNQAEKALIQHAITQYATFAENIYIHEGVGDIGVEQIRETINRHIRITGKKPVVLIDYLQILAPHEPRATDKQNTDKAVLELKRISRDNKITVIGISSFNRDNYNMPVSMAAFKESGAVEYSSDVLLGLQLEGVGTKDFNVDDAKAASPRRIELKVLKNRNGQTGGLVSYDYYPQFNYFEEGGVIAAKKTAPEVKTTTKKKAVKEKAQALKPKGEDCLVYSYGEDE